MCVWGGSGGGSPVVPALWLAIAVVPGQPWALCPLLFLAYLSPQYSGEQDLSIPRVSHHQPLSEALTWGPRVVGLIFCTPEPRLPPGSLSMSLWPVGAGGIHGFPTSKL